jgi:hypothetical protein
MKWRSDMNKAPTDELHVRGVWVHSASTGDRLYFEAVAGYVDEDGFFVNSTGEECGWRPEYFTYWMPLPEPPK